jgi:hypothetical protein
MISPRERYAEIHQDYMVLHALFGQLNDREDRLYILKLMKKLVDQAQELFAEWQIQASWRLQNVPVSQDTQAPRPAATPVLHTELFDGRLVRHHAEETWPQLYARWRMKLPAKLDDSHEVA